MKHTVNVKKRMQEIKFITEHTFTPEQYKERLEDKLKRAKLASEALKKREELLKEV